ncbi:hypothetical protein F5884DRAFT_224364 [Xylogone sp. PMI_703]|nr:hypothetical protein F5884DRAFT_224364 [Xylogone sp. PMI_703]
MWILSSDAPSFKGHSIWLRPGKKFLFGRTSDVKAGKFFFEEKSISRQHLTVEVEPVGARDCSDPNTRSKLILEDLNTKIGTIINGERKRGERVELQNGVNVVTLGRFKHPFQFTWVPVAFTFSFTGKEKKADPFTELYSTLGPLDIKVFDNYIQGVTTHVVARKRNTPKGLQALIDGKYIVNDTFVAAIVRAAIPPSPPPVPTPTPPNDGSSTLSPLEDEFDSNFPNPLEHLPPRGEEPTQRGSDAYAPDSARKGIFEGYTFIFYDKSQFNNLLPPITDGLGKALFYQAIPNETTVDDFVRYVKSVAGEKGLGEFEDGSEGKGVVVVRFNPVKGATRDWFVEFGTDVSLRLDHRLIEQNEFLDAILNNNPSVLRRPLQVEPSSTAPTSTAATAPPEEQEVPAPVSSSVRSEEVPVESQVRRGRSRRIVTSRFKGFDDDIDEPPLQSSVPEPMETDQPAVLESQSQGLFVSQDPEIDIELSQATPSSAQPRSRMKRPPSPIQEDDDEELMNQLAPAATALKKRRLADDIARRQRGESTPPPAQIQVEEEPVVRSPLKKVKKEKKEIDVLEIARQQREKEEAIAKAEREALEAAMEGMDIAQIRNLAVIEEMEIKRSEPLTRHRAYGDEGDRWNDKWNGRKNFKKFRRQGTETGRSKRFDRVIVPLEEVKKKDFGIGDSYWFEGDNSQAKKKRRGRDTQEEDNSLIQSSAATTEAAPTVTEQATEETAPPQQQEEEVSDSELPEVPPATASTQSQNTTRSQRLASRAKVSQTPSIQKRPASSTLVRAEPIKKLRQALNRDDSDESEDELKFKFRRRR